MEDLPTGRPEALFGIVADSKEIGFAMSCDARVGSLLATLATSKPGRRMLELGTGTGAGAAWLLDGMTADARLISVDMDERAQQVAIRHLGGDPRVKFERADAHEWLQSYTGGPFDLAFVDCRPGKFHDLDRLVGFLRPGALYVADDLMPQPTWPGDHQRRVDAFLAKLPEVAGLRATTMAWASGVVVAARI